MPKYTTYATPRLDLGVPFMEAMAKPSDFIADLVLPTVRTSVKTGTFTKITRESTLRDLDLKRASKGAYAMDDFEGEDDTFACEEYGIEIPVGVDEQAIYQNDFNAGAIAAQMAAQRLRLAREKRASTLLFNTTTWTGASLYLDGNAWSTTSNDILSNIQTAKDKVRTNVGMEADTLICNALNYGYLLTNDDIVGRVQNARVAGESAIKQELADILGLKKIIVGSTHASAGPSCLRRTACPRPSWKATTRTRPVATSTELAITWTRR